MSCFPDIFYPSPKIPLHPKPFASEEYMLYYPVKEFRCLLRSDGDGAEHVLIGLSASLVQNAKLRPPHTFRHRSNIANLDRY